jgi:hypothetical protein
MAATTVVKLSGAQSKRLRKKFEGLYSTKVMPAVDDWFIANRPIEEQVRRIFETPFEELHPAYKEGKPVTQEEEEAQDPEATLKQWIRSGGQPTTLPDLSKDLYVPIAQIRAADVIQRPLMIDVLLHSLNLSYDEKYVLYAEYPFKCLVAALCCDDPQEFKQHFVIAAVKRIVDQIITHQDGQTVEWVLKVLLEADAHGQMEDTLWVVLGLNEAVKEVYAQIFNSACALGYALDAVKERALALAMGTGNIAVLERVSALCMAEALPVLQAAQLQETLLALPAP